MERETIQKRCRPEDPRSMADDRRGKRRAPPSDPLDVGVEVSGDDRRRLGVFDFPWGKGKPVFAAELDEGFDLRDVFFSSLVDGSSAAFGFPGARLRAPPRPSISGEEEEERSSSSDGDADGVDCIWSCVMRQPLFAKGSTTA